MQFDGSRRSTFAGNNAMLPADVIDFAMLPSQETFGKKQFHC